MPTVLVVNSGSSSFKYQLIDVETERTLASGLVERIGDATGAAEHRSYLADAAGATTPPIEERWVIEREIPDHTAGFRVMLDAFAEHGPSLDEHAPIAVGHRVVHGGKRFFEPTVVTDLVKINIEDISELAPLHNPANLQGINAAQVAFPDVPHVAVFDTAFHQTIPAAAYTYAIDAELAAKHRVRRYGFHGTSHKFVSEAAAAFLDRPLGELKQIVFHLGNGASACAIDGGRSVDTSMGMTPLEGLVMGTRSGDLDPAVLFHLHRKAGLGFDELDTLLNRRSGLLGLSGTGDMRDVTESASKGDEAAQLALDVTVHRLRHYLGAYLAVLGGLDVVVFTAGVGENAPLIRAGAVQGLEGLGIVLDEDRNAERARGIRVISTDDSPVTVLVVPTNEELEIARQTVAALA
ncbi:acetate/propionate family kinase [Plantibacter sp. MMLR14_011]|uniref:acetate/propionate family kinase n=1 Tax=Plantibacter sp. MMLR14_011 TaxID=1898746 RepID=UPI0008DDC875|nr:acetate kinase [Plantibacter sp. MMLR14_011]OII43506.1 acetate kinase [Plantibacter sp. MMLR14_011]